MKKIVVTCDRCKEEFMPVAGDASNSLAILEMDPDTWDIEGDHLENFDMCPACMIAFLIWMGYTADEARALAEEGEV